MAGLLDEVESTGEGDREGSAVIFRQCTDTIHESECLHPAFCIEARYLWTQ